MNSEFILGIFVSIIAALMLNVGKGIQKQKVHVLKNLKYALRSDHRVDFIVWVVGVFLTATAVVPFSIAIKLTKSASIVSAMTGVGLAGLALYASKVLGEKLKGGDLLGILLVMIGTSCLSYIGAADRPSFSGFSDELFIKVIVILCIFSLSACALSMLFKKLHGVSFGLAAGVFIGIGLFMADVGLKKAGGSLSGQMDTPYPYLGLGFGACALGLTQLGFFKSPALVVVPTVNSAIVLTPVALEIMIYQRFPGLLSLVLIGVIVVGVVLISRGTAGHVE
jgi:multidrug transporter EmrE-like cation transporter